MEKRSINFGTSRRLGKIRRELEESIKTARHGIEEAEDGGLIFSGRLSSARVEEGKSDVLSYIASAEGITDEMTVRLARMFVKRAAIKLSHSIVDQRGEWVKEWMEFLDQVVRIGSNVVEQSETKRIWDGMAKLRKSDILPHFFPVQYHIDICQKRPLPPRAVLKPAGRAYSKNHIFFLVLSFLDARELARMSATCRGIHTFISTDKEIDFLWTSLARFHFGVTSPSINRTVFRHLWERSEKSCVLMFGDKELAERLVADDVFGKFQILPVDCRVQIGPSNCTNVSVAKALYCAAKALSPAIIFFRDPRVIEIESSYEKENHANLRKAKALRDKPKTSLAFLNHSSSRSSAKEGFEAIIRGKNEADSTIAKHIGFKDLEELCNLVRYDVSDGPVVVVCVSESPWLVPKRILQTFAKRIWVRKENCTPLRTELQRKEKAKETKIFLDRFLRDEKTSQSVEYEALIEIASKLSADQFSSLLSLATTKLLDRLGKAKYFKLQNGKYCMSQESEEGAIRMNFNQIGISDLNYGTFEIDDFLYATNSILKEEEQMLATGRNLAEDTKANYARRLSEWAKTNQ